MKFTVNGWDFEMTADQVREAMAGAEPKTIIKHAVEVDGRYFSAKRTFGIAAARVAGDASAVPEYECNEARYVLKSLGFPVRLLVEA